ncbi:MAG: KEOPS complex subunit Pcc1 [Candidatus Thermoplasmatota archaeon]|nr:KEOPS complex subunit Pcc1 [Candidatus Thermoplasmatota archaeon]
MHRAIITIESQRNDIIYNVIKLETAPRANVDICNGKALEIKISSKNAANLRAALNSFLKWIDLIDKIGDAVNSGVHT